MGQSDYEILTPSGWRDFAGIKRTPRTHKVELDGLTCTPEHQIKLYGRWWEAQEIAPVKECVEEYFYDPLGVDGIEYLSNDWVSHNCFLGSSATLINGRKLATLVSQRPQKITTLGVKVFHEVEDGHDYVATVDVSRGLGLDYQAIVVVDVTSKPWRVVASYRNNKLPPSLLHEVVYDVATYYNKAMALVETNDVGLRVAEDLLQVDEYEHVIMTQVKGKFGTRVGGGFGQQSRFGVKTSPQVKRIGCAILKQLVERDQLIVNDENILWEFGRFVGKNNTFKAEEGAHDDLVMCLVLFAWLTDQQYFKEAIDVTGLRGALLAQAGPAWGEEDLNPFGMVDTGLDDTSSDVDTAW